MEYSSHDGPHLHKLNSPNEPVDFPEPPLLGLVAQRIFIIKDSGYPILTLPALVLPFLVSVRPPFSLVSSPLSLLPCAHYSSRLEW